MAQPEGVVDDGAQVPSSLIDLAMVSTLTGRMGINAIGVASLVHAGPTAVISYPFATRRGRPTTHLLHDR